MQSNRTNAEIEEHVRRTLSRIRQERSTQPVFPPQFLARLHRIVIFSALDERGMTGIAERAAADLKSRWLASRKRTLHLSQDVLTEIGRLAAATNAESRGQEGGRIVHKLLADRIEYKVLQETVRLPEEYDRCKSIIVQLSDEPEQHGSFQVVFSDS